MPLTRPDSQQPFLLGPTLFLRIDEVVCQLVQVERDPPHSPCVHVGVLLFFGFEGPDIVHSSGNLHHLKRCKYNVD